MPEIQRNQLEPEVLSPQHTRLTAEDLWKQPDDGYRYELVEGVIRRMPPAGFEHGILKLEDTSTLTLKNIN